MNSAEKLNLLKGLHEKTVTWSSTPLHPNLSGKTFLTDISQFTKYVIPKGDFKKTLEIVKDELLLILPKENLMGYIEGYDILDLDGKLILRFGESNIPKEAGFTLEKIFETYVVSDENLEIHQQLRAEKKINCEIHENFEQYAY